MVGKSMMAACGLDCGSCEIRLAPTDPVAAKAMVAWFKRQGWLKDGEGMAQVMERKMYCTGCLGSRDTHWSSDCWILACCVDGKGLSSCAECESFPCDRLDERAKTDDGYAEGLARLRQSRGAMA
jgi:hypothetical protein